MPLGPDLYNGMSRHCAFSRRARRSDGHSLRAELARAAVPHLRTKLKARQCGANCALARAGRRDRTRLPHLCADRDGEMSQRRRPARRRSAAADLISEDLIAADKRLDVIGGSAGAILAPASSLPRHAIGRRARARDRCGEHLLAQPRVGAEGAEAGRAGHRSASAQRNVARRSRLRLCACLAVGRDGARGVRPRRRECIAFENSSYDAAHSNWPDLRVDDGSRLAVAMVPRRSRHRTCARWHVQTRRQDAALLAADIRNALAGAEQAGPATSTRSVAGRSAAWNFSAKPVKRSAAPTCARLRRGGWRLVVEDRGAAGDYRWNSGNGGSISVCSAALPALATPACGKSMPPSQCPDVGIERALRRSHRS